MFYYHHLVEISQMFRSLALHWLPFAQIQCTHQDRSESHCEIYLYSPRMVPVYLSLILRVCVYECECGFCCCCFFYAFGNCIVYHNFCGRHAISSLWLSALEIYISFRDCCLSHLSLSLWLSVLRLILHLYSEINMCTIAWAKHWLFSILCTLCVFTGRISASPHRSSTVMMTTTTTTATKANMAMDKMFPYPFPAVSKCSKFGRRCCCRNFHILSVRAQF